MKLRRIEILVALLVALAGLESFASQRAENNNPYRLIGDRNLFRLQPAVAHVEPPPPLARILLQGVTSSLGRRYALLLVTAPGSQQSTARPEAFVLAEGESAGGVALLQVEEKSGKVRVNNCGVEQTLELHAESAR
ncbi:MAG: hypothetical protein EPO07_05370 [Verrucomicrobia bacterium]|nr:MAG: hypothetical protein EPO07_05370 [Verrucomicrobiota bacterium]